MLIKLRQTRKTNLQYVVVQLGHSIPTRCPNAWKLKNSWWNRVQNLDWIFTGSSLTIGMYFESQICMDSRPFNIFTNFRFYSSTFYQDGVGVNYIKIKRFVQNLGWVVIGNSLLLSHKLISSFVSRYFTAITKLTSPMREDLFEEPFVRFLSYFDHIISGRCSTVVIKVKASCWKCVQNSGWIFLNPSFSFSLGLGILEQPRTTTMTIKMTSPHTLSLRKRWDICSFAGLA